MLDRNKVKEKIADHLRLPFSKVEDDIALTSLVTESFALVEMVIELQEEFGIRLVQEDLKNVKTVGDLTELFESRANG
ncbi:MAG: phosphopantetheine-binding protein [Blastocatellia bacterium]